MAAFMITGTTQLLGVVGYPVEHSLSPVMHNAAIAHLGLDYAYLPLPVHPKDLAQAIAGFNAIGLQGFSVTIPHKQAIMPLLNEISAIAQVVGAVNTVYRTPQGWSGTNTDVVGFLAPLQQIDRDWQQQTALILGNGGAARAVVVGCAQLGIAKIQVVGRDQQKLQTFCSDWPDLPLSVHLWSELSDLIAQADLLVNTTPIGMAPQVDASPLTAIELAHLPTTALVYDLIYTPNPTRLLQQSSGAIAIDGLEMLVQQGAAALEIWLQHPAPVEVMRRSLRQVLFKSTI
jgi:shikimate dehydrogenase